MGLIYLKCFAMWLMHIQYIHTLHHDCLRCTDLPYRQTECNGNFTHTVSVRFFFHVTHPRVQKSNFPSFSIFVGDLNMLMAAGVNHHVPWVAVQPVGPVVVTLHENKTLNNNYMLIIKKNHTERFLTLSPLPLYKNLYINQDFIFIKNQKKSVYIRNWIMSIFLFSAFTSLVTTPVWAVVCSDSWINNRWLWLSNYQSGDSERI